MDYSLDEQQEMMQTLARDFLTDQYPEKVLRAVAAGDAGMAESLWRKMAEMNLMGLSLPEEHGGLGDVLDLVVVLEEMGKACFISPYFASVVLGAGAIALAGTDDQKADYFPAIAEGKLKATLAVPENGNGGIAVTKQGTGYVLSGEAWFVPDAATADIIVIAAKDADGQTTLFTVPPDAGGLKITPLTLISGEPSAIVACDNVTLDGGAVLGEPGAGADALEAVLVRAAVARAAGMAGLARKALDLALEYAKERIAFDHPIGAFQSIQHDCADMLIDVEGSRFLTCQAAWRLANGLPAEKEAAIAAAWVGRACRRVMQAAHQIHGAIGFSEDHVLHYYIKMAGAWAAADGGPDRYLEKVAVLS
jgi:alkylation response protein AidB-like acyl-CoA dehydrogenase